MGGRGGGGEASAGMAGTSMSSIEQAMPGFYSNPTAYGADKETRDTVLRARDHPDRLVRVYRPVGAQRGLIPSAFGTVVITHGQYVTSSRENAARVAGPNGTVHEFSTQAGNLSPTGSGNANDWSYSGPDRRAPETADSRQNRLRQ